jgi:hypothetical protein
MPSMSHKKNLLIVALALLLLCGIIVPKSSAAQITYGKKVVKAKWMVIDKRIDKYTTYSLGGKKFCYYDEYVPFTKHAHCATVDEGLLRGPYWVYSGDDFSLEMFHYNKVAVREKYHILKVKYKIIKGSGKLKKVSYLFDVDFPNYTFLGVYSKNPNLRIRRPVGEYLKLDGSRNIVTTTTGCTLRVTMAWKPENKQKWSKAHVDIKVKPKPRG